MSPEQIAEIDRCLAPWRQGDVVLSGDVPFVHLANLALPTTSLAEQLADEQGSEGLAIVSADVLGLVVVTQTCDIVRTCRNRPYVEVCRVVEVPDDQVELLHQGRLGRFAALPALSNRKFAADLDCVMTIEKGLLASMSAQRTGGVTSESEARILTETLGRKRTRAALPDEFSASVGRMRNHIQIKHRALDREGEFLRAVKEIRVRGIPDWQAQVIEVEFLFLFDHGGNIPSDADHWIDLLMEKVRINERIAAVEARPVGLDQLSAALYVESYRLDLDHLSYGTQP